MLIADLDHLESVEESHAISGAVWADVISYASATGNSTYTLAAANVRVRELRNGMTIAIGRGKAIAIGDTPVAAVGVAGSGDRVIAKTFSLSIGNKALARGFVIAIDYP